MKTHRTHSFSTRGGMTLIELMIAMIILSIFSMSVISVTLLARRLAEANIYQNTAMTVAQGYMEQFKSMEYAILLHCLSDPAANPVPCKSISALLTGDIEIDDPLTINAWNEKNVMIDLRTNPDGSRDPQEMMFKIKPTVTNLNAGANPLKALEIKLDYEYLTPEKGALSWKANSVRFVKSYVPTF